MKGTCALIFFTIVAADRWGYGVRFRGDSANEWPDFWSGAQLRMGLRDIDIEVQIP